MKITRMEADKAHARVWGRLDERADFNTILETNVPQVVLDLGGVEEINSSGVRLWMQFVQNMNDKGKRISLENCSTAVVKQLNMIYHFAGVGGSVRSVRAPFFCTNCDTEHDVMVTVSGRNVPSLDANMSCPNCKKPGMEFDEDPDFFFSFLNLDYLDFE